MDDGGECSLNIVPQNNQLPQPVGEWVDRGRELVQQRKDVDWRLAEWMAEGKNSGFIEQTKFDFLSEQLGISPKLLKDAQKAALTFPASKRAKDLTIEHHAIVASLPEQEALEFLKEASEKKLRPNELQEKVTQHRYETATAFEDDDLDATHCTRLVRAWNRATVGGRELFSELLEYVDGYGVIDEDEVM